MPIGLPLANAPDADLMAQLLGVEPPDTQPDLPVQQFHPQGLDSVAEHFAGIQAPHMPPSAGFGGGFAQGLLAGLSAKGSRVAQTRQKFEADQNQRSSERARANASATEDFRRRRRDALRSLSRQETDSKRGTVRITDSLVQRFPELKGMEDERVPESVFKRLTEPAKPAKSVKAEQSLEDKIKEREALAEATARGRNRGATEGTPPGTTGGKKNAPPRLTGTERTAIVTDQNLLDQAANIRRLFKPEYVGPMAQWKTKAKLKSGVGYDKGLALFTSALAKYRNAVISRLSGAQVSKHEEKRMMQELADLSDPSSAFIDKLDATDLNIKGLADTRKKLLRNMGMDIGDVSSNTQPAAFSPVDAESLHQASTDRVQQHHAEDSYQKYLKMRKQLLGPH